MIPLAERYRLPISQRTRILLVAIILVLLAGIAVAATEPGSLGDDDNVDVDRTAAELTTTTTEDDDSSAAQEPTSTTAAESPETTTTTEAVDDSGEEGSPGSGLGSSGSGSAGEGDLADTGGVPLALPGVVLLVAAGLSRRLAAR